MLRQFIRELWHRIRSSYDGIGLWIGAIITILQWLLPTFKLGDKVNAIVATISLTCRLLILQSCLFVSVILASYSLYKKQEEKIKEHQDEIESLKKQHRVSFFEDNTNVVVKSLEGIIRELDDWFACASRQPNSRCEELKRILLEKIAPAISPINKKSKTGKSMNGSIGDMLLFLNYHNSEFASPIQAKYESIIRQYNIIIEKCKDVFDTSPFSLSEITELPNVDIFNLKDNMQKLANDLHSCKQIIKEERK
jgi:hypothetical protein